MADTTRGIEIITGLRTDYAAAPDVHRDDECLVDALRTGDDQAYEILIEMYQQPVYNLVIACSMIRRRPPTSSRKCS